MNIHIDIVFKINQVHLSKNGKAEVIKLPKTVGYLKVIATTSFSTLYKLVRTTTPVEMLITPLQKGRNKHTGFSNLCKVIQQVYGRIWSNLGLSYSKHLFPPLDSGLFTLPSEEMPFVQNIDNNKVVTGQAFPLKDIWQHLITQIVKNNLMNEINIGKHLLSCMD